MHWDGSSPSWSFHSPQSYVSYCYQLQDLQPYQAEVRKVEEQEGHRMELDGVPLTDWNLEWISLLESWYDILMNLESHEFIEFGERVVSPKTKVQRRCKYQCPKLDQTLESKCTHKRKWCTTKSSLDSSCVFHLLGLLVLRLHHDNDIFKYI